MSARLIHRRRYRRAVVSALENNPIWALLGPRQCGKTTLARNLAARRRDVHIFDLETAAGRARLAEPELTLEPLEGLVIIDEVQRQPELFEAIRPLADRAGTPARFLLLGSASPDRVRGVSESLAGRVGFVDLGGFDLSEVGAREWRRLWVRGGFPRSYLAASDDISLKWRRDFIRTFLERDVPQLGIRIPAEPLGRFWMMLAHYHGQIWNGAEIARSMASLKQPCGDIWRFLPALTWCAGFPRGSRTYRSGSTSRRSSTSATAVCCTPCSRSEPSAS